MPFLRVGVGLPYARGGGAFLVETAILALVALRRLAHKLGCSAGINLLAI